MTVHSDAAAARAKAYQQDRARQLVTALEVERRGYVVRGLDTRVAQVDEQLAVARERLAGLEDVPAVDAVVVEVEGKRRGRGSVRAALEAEAGAGDAGGEAGAGGEGDA